MAIKTVTGSTSRPFVHVQIQLSQPCTITATGVDAPNLINATGDGAGAYSTTLWANNDLTPNGTYYTVTEFLGITDNVFAIQVPQTAGPFPVTTILVTPPTAVSAGPNHVSTLIVDGTSGVAINAAGDVAARSFTASSTSPNTPNPAIGAGSTIYTVAGVDAGFTVTDTLSDVRLVTGPEQTHDWTLGRATEIRSTLRDGYYGITLNTPQADSGTLNGAGITFDLAGKHRWTMNLDPSQPDGLSLAFDWKQGGTQGTPCVALDMSGDGQDRLYLGNGIGWNAGDLHQFLVSSAGLGGNLDLDQIKTVVNTNTERGIYMLQLGSGTAAASKLRLQASNSLVEGDLIAYSTGHSTRPNQFWLKTVTASPIIVGPNDVATVQYTNRTGLSAEGSVIQWLAQTIPLSGSFATQRTNLIAAPTYTGAFTLTTAATLAISDAPQASGGATITNPWALMVQAGKSIFQGQTFFRVNSSQQISMDNASAGTQTSFALADNGTAIWQFGKQTGNNFFFYDVANNVQFLNLNRGSVTTGQAAFGVPVLTLASVTGSAGFNVPHGVAPTSPVNGDFWTTTAGMFVRINGVTRSVNLT